MNLRAGILLLVAAARVAGQDPDLDSLLARSINVMRHAAARMRDFTCTQFITRSIFESGAAVRMDRLRLEVGFIGGKELFGWPGRAVEHEDPDHILTGVFSTGAYAGFAGTIFGSEDVRYGEGDPDVLAGRKVVRYPYEVIQPHYLVRSGAETARLRYHGLLWVDPETAGVLAFSVIADQIPAALGIVRLDSLIELAWQGADENAFPFPNRARLTTAYAGAAREARLHTNFTSCRQFSADSSIRFGETVASAAGGHVAPEARPAPPGLKIEAALETPIDEQSSAAGDVVSAVVVRPAGSGALRVPEGARLHGRLVLYEMDLKESVATAAISFDEIEIGAERLKFRGQIDACESRPGIELRKVKTPDLLKAMAGSGNGVAVLAARMYRGLVPAGFRMTWRSR